VAAQRKIKWLGTGAEIEAPKALRSETAKASRGVGAPAENDLYCFFGVTLGLSLRYLYVIPSPLLPLLPPP